LSGGTDREADLPADPARRYDDPGIAETRHG